MSCDVKEIISAISSVIGDVPRPVSLHEPLFIGNEKTYVDSCIDEGWVSSVGAFVDRFERDLAAYCGVKHAVVTVNGTCALHATLVALGVQPNDEVLIPSLTFVATANAVSHAGAVPHFVEVEEQSLGVCPAKLEHYLSQIATIKNGKTVNKITGRIITALMPVHVFGHPCQILELAKVAEKYGLIFVEDATEALGSMAHGKPVGGEHTMVLSFNGNKIITTGGGGAILTNSDILHAKLKHLTTTAKQPHKWAFSHDEVAWNYRMPNLNAALGCAQLEQLPKFIFAKRLLAQRYIDAFANVRGVNIITEPSGTQSNYWLVALIADINTKPQWLDITLRMLHDVGLLCRPVWQPLHLLPMYSQHPRADLLLTESLATRIINLPSSVKLGMRYAD